MFDSPSWMPDVVVLFVYERTGRLSFAVVVGFLEPWFSYGAAMFVLGLVCFLFVFEV